MSNLLKSKFLFGVVAFAIVAVVASVAMFTAVLTADAYTHSITLKQGSSGPQVVSLQQALGVSADGKFGPMTRAAVVAFQSSKGLVADGIVGPATGAALAGVVPGVPGGNLPQGCTSTAGFSPVTGAPCNSGTSSLPAGCMPGYAFSATTGQSCTGGSTPSTSGPLAGDSADIEVKNTAVGTEDDVKEGTSEKVFAFKVKALDGDVRIQNVKLTFENDSENGSERFTRYADEVTVYLGSTEVGSSDVSDFTRTSGDPDTYSRTITLNNAVIRKNQELTFYVSVAALSNINDSDLDAVWTVVLNSLRFEDPTGLVLAVAPDGEVSDTFQFEDATADDSVSIKSSSKNPNAASFQVKEKSASSEVLVGAFRFDVDEDSSDITFLELPIVFTVDNGGLDLNDAEQLFNQVRVKIDGSWYDADLEDSDIFEGAGTALYVVDLDDEDVVVEAGDIVDVEIYVKFAKYENNYDSGTTVSAYVDGGDIEAEGNDETVEVDGSFTGKVHTLSANAPTFSLVSKKLVLSQAIDGVGSGQEDIFLAEFVFNVSSADEDVFLPKEIGTDGETGIEFSVAGGATVLSAVIDAEDNNIEEDNSFKVAAGDTEKFTVSIFLAGNNAANKVTITSFWYEGEESDPDGDPEVTSGLTNFATSTVFLSK